MSRLWLALSISALAACSSLIGSGGTDGTPTPTPTPTGTPRSGKGLLPHIDVLDFGRTLVSGLGTADDQTAVDWFVKHVDVAEENWPNNTHFKTAAPKIKTFKYRFDATIFQDPYSWEVDPDTLPEEYFLHFSETTVMNFGTRDGGTPPPSATLTIPGCPEPAPITKACRVQVFMWDNLRWVFSMGNPNFRTWQAATLLDQIGPEHDGIYVDEHIWGMYALYWGDGPPWQNFLTSGGGIRELQGLRQTEAHLPGKDYNALDKAYQDTVTSWFVFLRSKFDEAGKFIIINPAGCCHELEVPMILAANGVSYESVHRPDYWYDAEQFSGYVAFNKTLTAQGGIADLLGNICDTGPAGYTAGSYPSAKERYIMWRLAAYYLVRAPLDSPGIVYFNPDFCYNDKTTPLTFTQDWLPAFEWNIGTPEADAYILKTVTRTCNGGSHTFNIWARNYTNGFVVVRPRDFYYCTDYDHTVNVTVPSAMKLLKGDGTFGPSVATYNIRNGEAFVLAK